MKISEERRQNNSSIFRNNTTRINTFVYCASKRVKILLNARVVFIFLTAYEAVFIPTRHVSALVECAMNL